MQTLELHFSSRGEGPPLLLLHGLYGSGNNWLSHARWLEKDFRVILPDLRNHGRSPHAEPMDYPAMAADIGALLDRLDIEQALILGHSMGGKTAMTLALQAPGRVRALIAADIAPVTYRQSHGHDDILDALRALPLTALESRAAADRALAERIESSMVRQFLLTNLERGDDGYRWRIPLDTLTAAMPAIRGFPELSGRYEGPTLFIHGAASDYLTEDALPAVRRYFPQAQVETLAETGHWLHVERPEAFAEALRRFLSPFRNAASPG